MRTSNIKLLRVQRKVGKIKTKEKKLNVITRHSQHYVTMEPTKRIVQTCIHIFNEHGGKLLQARGYGCTNMAARARETRLSARASSETKQASSTSLH